jgi:hypothetical protein
MSDELTITGGVSMETMRSLRYTTQVTVGETFGRTIMESPMYQMEIGEGVILYVGGQTQPQELQSFAEIIFKELPKSQTYIMEEITVGTGVAPTEKEEPPSAEKEEPPPTETEEEEVKRLEKIFEEEEREERYRRALRETYELGMVYRWLLPHTMEGAPSSLVETMRSHLMSIELSRKLRAEGFDPKVPGGASLLLEQFKLPHEIKAGK